MHIARVAVIAVLGLGACAKKHSVVESSPYAGPAITLDSSGPRHTAILAAPSSGYRVQFDRTERRFDATDVFMTVTRPDPTQMHAQAMVSLNLDTTVLSGEAIVVYARIRDFGASGVKAPYRPAAESGKSQGR
jgi:hypothetical protein